MRSWPTSLRHCRSSPKPAAHSIDSQSCGRSSGTKRCRRPLRDEDVVVRRRTRTSPSGERSSAAALEDEVELVAVAVREVDRVGLVGVDDRDDDVVVEEQRHARVDGGAAPARQLLRAVVAARQRARLVVGCRRGSPSRARRSRARCGVRPLEVVEDRERPVEAVAGEALLVAQAAAASRSAVWGLSGTVAGGHAIEHRSLTSAARRRAPPACRPAACSRSIASNSARKLPGAEALVALALDDLEEERPRLGVVVEAGRLLEEDLQQVLPRLARRRPGSRARAGRRCSRRCRRRRCSRRRSGSTS